MIEGLKFEIWNARHSRQQFFVRDDTDDEALSWLRKEL